MSQTKGWQEVFQPWLKAKLNQSFPDPSKFTRDEEFLYAAKVASVFKKVIAEILMEVELRIVEAKALQEKEKNKVIDPYRIGGEM